MSEPTNHWAQVERKLRDKAYGTLDADPQILLEGDGGPVGMQAELIYARLIGFEEEVVEDGLQLAKVEPRILMPIQLDRWSLFDDDDLAAPSVRVAIYELQSGFVALRVSAEFLPPDVPVGPDCTARILYLRYRRRS